MIYLIFLFTILFVILAWRRLDWAFMLLIAALPAYLIRFNIFGLPLTVLEIMIWVVFLVWLLKGYRGIIENLKLKIGYLLKIGNCKLEINFRYPFDWEIVLLLMIALTAAGLAGFGNSSMGIWKAYFFEPILVFIVAVNLMAKSPPPPFIKGGNAITPPHPPLKGGMRGLDLALWPLAISALAVSALAIYQKFSGSLIDNPEWAMAETRRVVSFFGYPNAVGLYLGPLIMVFIGWLVAAGKSTSETILQSQRNPKSQIPNPKQTTNPKSQTDSRGLLGHWGLGFRWSLGFRIWDFKVIFIALTIVASLFSIYFVRSKGALVGVAAGFVVFGLLAGKKARLATVVILVLISLGIAAYQPAQVLILGNLTLTNKSGQIRKAGWSDGWNMLKDGRLLGGAGLANYQAAVKPYHAEGIFIKDYNDPDAQRKLVFNEAYRTAHWQPLEIYLYPHNIILNFWSELGLAGVLLFIWVIGKYLYLGIFNFQFSIFNKFSINKFLNIGLICAMVVIIVHGLVDVPYFKNDLAVMFWLFVAIMGLVNLSDAPFKSGNGGILKHEKNLQQTSAR